MRMVIIRMESEENEGESMGIKGNQRESQSECNI